MGIDPASRQAAYRALLDDALSPDQVDIIRTHTQQQRVLGNPRVQAQFEALTQRVTTVRPRG